MESVNYRNGIFTDMESVNYGYGICKPSTLRHFSVFTDTESVNQAPYTTFQFLRIRNL